MKKILFFVFLILISFGLSSCNEEDIIDELDDLKQLSTPEVFISETGLASWDKVKHAEGYAYRINGEKAIETLELEVQLEEGDSIRVKAIGDGEKYKDSKYSDGKIYESKTKEETNPDTQTPPNITPPLEERTITIYFKANGGSGYMSSQKVSIAEDVYLKENKFYRDGYEFIGWALSSSIDYALFVDYIPKSFLEELSVNTVTLYAVWEANSQDYSQPLDIWVGSESAAYYQEVMDEYAKKYNLPFEVRVTGMDTGSAADTFLTDPEAGADIFTVPHDSLGKLLAGSGQIAAIKSESLLEQIESNNPKSFLNVCYLQAEDGSAAEFYAAPIMSQALVLYYNKEVFKGQEEKLASWEGIMEVAKANNAMATSFQGADGYNYSAFLLAQPYNEAAKAVFGTQGTLQLYRDGVQANCMGYGDDQVAINKWAQRFITNLNGRDSSVMSYNGWYTELACGEAITLVGGSWSLNSVKDALGRNNYGIVELPTFTLTAADAYGKAKAGMTFHSGSYVDAKCLVKKKDSVFSEYLDDIIEYLTSDEIQKRSYEECGNQPASINVELGDNELALAQQAQSKYGIAQPFGYKAKYNTYYYSKGAPDLYVAIHQNTEGAYATDAQILAKLQEISYIWAMGRNPMSEEVLRDWVNSKDIVEPTPEPTLPEETIGYYVVGGYLNDWSDYTSNNYMQTIDLLELPENLRAQLLNKDIVTITKLENREFGIKGDWTAPAYINGEIVYLDGGYTIKIVKAEYDAMDEVYFANQWNPDPKTSHVQNLTPNTLFMPKWIETPIKGEEHLGKWDENPVVISGEGLYTVYFIEYKGTNSSESPKYAMGVVKTSGDIVINDDFEDMRPNGYDVCLGEGNNMVNGYGSVPWDSYAAITKDPFNNQNATLMLSYTVENKEFSSFYKFVEIKPNATYKIEFDYLVVGETDNFGMRFAGNTSVPEKTFYNGGSTNGWQHASWEWTTSVDSWYDSISFWFNTHGDVTNIGYVDNIKISIVDVNGSEIPGSESEIENPFKPDDTYYQSSSLIVNGDFEAFDAGIVFSEEQLEGVWSSISLDNPATIQIVDGSKVLELTAGPKTYSSAFLMLPDTLEVGDLLRITYDVKLVLSNEAASYIAIDTCLVGSSNISYYLVDFKTLDFAGNNKTSGEEAISYPITVTPKENGWYTISFDFLLTRTDVILTNSLRFLFTAKSAEDHMYIDNVNLYYLSETEFAK